MFFKRLFGISESNQGEVLTKVNDRTWVSSTGETINKVSDDVSISSSGTTYTRTGSTVVGSDGSLFTSLGAQRVPMAVSAWETLRQVEAPLSKMTTRNGDLNRCGIMRINEDSSRAGPDFRIFPQDSDASSVV